MARRYQRLHRRRRPQNRKYVIPVVLIICLVIAVMYGIWGRNEDKDQDSNNTADNKAAVNMSKVEEKEPLVDEKKPVVAKQRDSGPLPKSLPEKLPPPVPEPIPEPEPKKEVLKETPKEEPKEISPVVSPEPDVSPNPEATALIAEATALLAEKPAKIIAARTKFSQVFHMPMSRQQRTFVKDQLSQLAEKWLFSPTIYPDDGLCSSYKVRPGDLLNTIAKQYKVPWEVLMKVNNIRKPEALRAGAIIKVIHGPFHARVDRSDFVMDLYLQDKTFVRSFRVGLGKPGRDTPTGLWRVKSNGKLVKPPWPDPDTGRMYYPEDPAYPLGSRWIGLDGLEGNAKGRTGFGIHGTQEPEQIGKADSRGCIRMYNGDVILVYDLMQPGISTVRVVD
ncbi:MAG: L,D-transpeptidase family protein [Sedimentisphaerales bacterium]|nr:L,D-transpeptidase family protein [Sedimentisphaerales bacterium]